MKGFMLFAFIYTIYTMILIALYILMDHAIKCVTDKNIILQAESESVPSIITTENTQTGNKEISENDPGFYDFFQKRELEYEKRVGYNQLHDIDDLRAQNSDKLPEQINGSVEISNITLICEDKNNQNCVPKFQHSRSMYYAIICYLMFPDEFLKTKRKLAKEAFGARYCKHKDNHFWSTDAPKYSATHFNATIDEALAMWRPFAMVRDPVDRFLSAYVDKCLRDTRRPLNSGTSLICNGCAKNLTCFIVSEYQRMLNFHGFSEDTFEDNHFMPQNWECNFRQYFSHFEFLVYNNLNRSETLERLSSILHSRNISVKNIDHIRFDLNRSNTDHKTSGSPARIFLEKRLRESRFLMEYIMRMYYWDYKIFQFSLPELNMFSNKNII